MKFWKEHYKIQPITPNMAGREVLRLKWQLTGSYPEPPFREPDITVLNTNTWIVEGEEFIFEEGDLLTSLDEFSSKYLSKIAAKLALPDIPPEVLYYWAT